jgi:hypothetical protein
MSSFILVPANIIVITMSVFSDLSAHIVLIVQEVIFLIGPLLGISAWILANRDHRRIRNGLIPLSAFNTTRWGEVLAIIGTIVNPIISIVILTFALFTASNVSSPKDAIINDLGNLDATAYQYRIRPTSMGGGGGSYTGFVIPGRMSRNENGVYTATVIHADTIQFYARWVVDSTSTITARVDADGRLSRWTYTGTFE